MKRKRRFYSVLVCQKGADYCEENLGRIINGSYFVFGKDTVQCGCYKEPQPGDILLLNYQGLFVAFTEVSQHYHETTDVHWNQVISTKEWVMYDSADWNAGVNAYGIKWSTIAGGDRGVVKEITPGWAFSKMKDIKSTDPLIQKIINEMTDIKEQAIVAENISILKELKPQLILQGPPGTGKTRLAKMIARQMTQGQVVDNPMTIIDEFLQNFNPSDPKTQAELQEDDRVRNEFLKRFPVSSLRQLTPEAYAIGRSNQDNFCWWIERGLPRLGRYAPGKSPHYYIYWSKKDGGYKMSGKLLSGAKDAEEGMERLAAVLADVVEQKDVHKGDAYIGDSFLLKILNTYYPDEFFPINGREALDAALSLFGFNGKNLSKLEKNKKLNELFQQKKAQLKSGATTFAFMRFLFGHFDLKGGTLYQSETVTEAGQFKIVQFHPSFTYEDFVRGIVVRPDDKGLRYVAENKILIELANEALENPSGNYVLILDEINRANLSSVLGELIYALEYRFNPDKPDEHIVESLYEVQEEDGDDGEPTRELRLPPNLYIIGTMNTADRSAGHIDYAIRRRFAFLEVIPSKDPVHPLAQKLFANVSALFIKNADAVDADKPVLQRSDFLSPDFRPEDVWIGHSYFISEEKDLAKVKEELRLKLRYEIIPLLKEYLKDGVLLPTANDEIDKLYGALS